MWASFRLSIEQWAPECRIVYDKFHIIQHANDAIEEVRRAEFFRKRRKMFRLQVFQRLSSNHLFPLITSRSAAS
jgi:transposase